MPTRASSTGRELFIVDNSVAGWTGLRYLEEWCQIAKAFDIATGYFEIGALLALEGKWQKVDKIRILMGAEIERTRTPEGAAGSRACRAPRHARQQHRGREGGQPLPHGVPAILEALRSGQIECRVYDKDKFHAKAYITHAKLEVVGPGAGRLQQLHVPGLTKNIELNVQIQSAAGRPAPGVVRDPLERATEDADADVIEDDRAAHPPLHPVRRLREGAPGVLPRPRADRNRVGRRQAARRCSRSSTAIRRRPTGR